MYNHKVVTVELAGIEDVYDGTVDLHHNFAIITSQIPSAMAPRDAPRPPGLIPAPARVSGAATL